MFKGVEITGTPISCSNKVGCEKLKEIHYGINSIIFKNNYRFLSPIDAKCMYLELCDYGKCLKSIEVPEKVIPKQNELLSKLRIVCKNLKNYSDTYRYNKNDVTHINLTIKFFMSQVLNEMSSNELTPEKIIDFLNEYKRIRKNMVEPASVALNMNFPLNDKFKKLPMELFEALKVFYLI